MTLALRFVSRVVFGNVGLGEVRRSDFAFVFLLRLVVLAVVLLFIAIAAFLYKGSIPILSRDGWHFFIGRTWNPTGEEYGALPFMYGTLITSALAVLFAVPVAVGSAIFLTEMSPSWLAKPVGFLIEMLAAIPSVVYGLWGIFVLAPFVRTFIQPALGASLGFLPLFQGPPFGIGIFTAGLILAVMILPTIMAVCREVFLAIPRITREGALSLGATRWETIKLAVLQTGLPGILSAVILGLGRAMGETMAVTMLIGNRAVISASLFSPGATMSSVIANEYPEAQSDMHMASLTAVGLALFLVSLVVNAIARWVIAVFGRSYQR